MPEWLHDSFSGATGVEMSLGVVALRLAISILVGFLVALVYAAAKRQAPRETFSFLMTLVLLTVLVAMTTLVIGNNVARAFSLVGALAIVRFRTIVEDTRDTAFVIFAVVAGMAVGAGHYGICLLGVPAVALVALGMGAWGRRLSGARRNGEVRVLVRVGAGREPDALLRDSFARHLAAHRLTASATSRQGSALDLHYAVKLRDGAPELGFLRELSALDGVQNVEVEIE